MPIKDPAHCIILDFLPFFFLLFCLFGFFCLPKIHSIISGSLLLRLWGESHWVTLTFLNETSWILSSNLLKKGYFYLVCTTHSSLFFLPWSEYLMISSFKTPSLAVSGKQLNRFYHPPHFLLWVPKPSSALVRKYWGYSFLPLNL